MTLEPMPGGRILIGHIGGGAVHREDGTLEKTIQTEFTPPDDKPFTPNISKVSIKKNILVSVFGHDIFQFKI